MKRVTTKNADETKKIASDLAKDFSSGGVIALSGELGAGKTTFAQGFAEGLGIKGKIISPTFLIIRQYPIPGRENFFYHIDLYRLEEIDMKHSGLEEILFDPENVVLIEWADKIFKHLPAETVKIRLEKQDENSRNIKLE